MFWLLASLLPPAAATPGFDGNCCRSKLVDNKFYYLVDKRDTSEFSCQDECVYKRLPDFDSRFQLGSTASTTGWTGWTGDWNLSSLDWQFSTLQVQSSLKPK